MQHEPLRSHLVTALVVLLAAGVWTGCAGTRSSPKDVGTDASSAAESEAGPQPLDAPVAEELREGIRNGTESFDHGAFDALLSEHVNLDEGTVDYSALKKDRSQLESYLSQIAGADLETLGRDAQLAFLINAYNAYTLELVVENYPGIESIRDLSDPWTTERFEVGGHTLSLDQIEHRLIRPLHRDSRIHFAVNCAAVDCPYLADFAYEGSKIDEQLDRRTRATLQNNQFARVRDNTLEYTRVMKWYRSDFVDSDYDPSAETVASYVADYSTKSVRGFVEKHDGEPPARAMDYDWNLNDAD